MLFDVKLYVGGKLFTEPKKFTKSYTEACKIADTHYNITGEIVAVEEVVNHV